MPLPHPTYFLLIAHYFNPSILGPILEFLDEWGTENLDMVDIREIANPKTTKVFVNGNWVGVHRDPEDLIGKYVLTMCAYVCIRFCRCLRVVGSVDSCHKQTITFPLTLTLFLSLRVLISLFFFTLLLILLHFILFLSLSCCLFLLLLSLRSLFLPLTTSFPYPLLQVV